MGKKDKKDKTAAKEAKRAKQESKAARSATKKVEKEEKEMASHMTPAELAAAGDEAIAAMTSAGKYQKGKGGEDPALSKSQAKKKEKEKDLSKAKDVAKMLKEMARDALLADNTPVVTPGCAQPSPRTNFSLTPWGSGGELLVFGGEYCDGKVSQCSNDLFRWHVESDTWTLVTSAGAPPPRCSHQAVIYRDELYVFGGEFATMDQFHHYRDFWALDLKTNRWRQLEAPGTSPSPRSGHRMVVWRNYLVVFGGFYETYRETKWFNDTFLYSFAASGGAWSKVELPPNAVSMRQAPSPRSGCQLALHGPTDCVFALGGYAKIKAGGSSETGATMTDIWALHLAPVAKGHPPHWERVTRKGAAPCPRSGATCAVYKNRAIQFGGVVDRDGKGKSLNMDSSYYNDLHAFDLDRRRWYHLAFRAPKGEKKKGKKAKKPKAAGGGGAGGKKKKKKGGGGGRAGGGSSSDSDGSDGSSDGEDDDEDEDEDEGEEGRGRDGKERYAYIVDGDIVYMTASDSEEEEEEEEEDGGEGEGRCGEGGVAAAAESDASAPADPPPAPPPSAESDAGVGGVAAAAAAEGDAAAASSAASAVVAAAAATAAAAAEAEAAAAEDEPAAEAEEAAAPAPVPRFAAPLAVLGNSIFLYGGIVEAGRNQSKEITLDDCWSLDLRQLQAWTLRSEGTWRDQEWAGSESESDESDEDDEDDEDYSSSSSSSSGGGGDTSDESDSEGEVGGEGGGAGAGAGAGAGDDDEEEEDEETKEEAPRDLASWRVSGAAAVAAPSAAAAAEDEKKAKKKAKKKKEKKKKLPLREEIASLRESLGLADPNVTPAAGEKKRDFFERTAAFWAVRATERFEAEREAEGSGATAGERKSAKELRQLGYQLASERYLELEPTLGRLNELEEQQKKAEEEAEAKKAKKKKKKSSRQ